MAGKKKKEKKVPKENKDQISAVDKTFYELTITDLNNKLAHLRTDNASLEERNVDLEARMVQLDEDRSDVTAYLNRTLNTQANNIKDFEEKLSELAKVRATETESFQNKIKDWELKYKAMHDQLTSEIKLLTGKLNSLEEFRIQKDELMAKYDQQETDLKEQNQRHKDTLYELERKQILDKNHLKNDVENRLLQLSNEFARSNEIRIAAHVQRMVRENIAINNELDRLLYTNERLKSENKIFSEQNTEQRLYSETILEENAHLVDTCQKHLKIITKLTTVAESLKEKLTKHTELDKMRQMAEVRETVARKELNESKSKLQTIQKKVIDQEHECKTHVTSTVEYKKEINRLVNILRQLKKTVNDAIQNECDHDASDAKSLETQRKHLLNEFQNILLNVKDETEISIEDSPLTDKIPPLSRIIYRKGKIGIVPQHSTHRMFKYSHSMYKGRKQSLLDMENLQSSATGSRKQSTQGCLIIDADSSLGLLQSTDSIQVDDEDVTPTIKSIAEKSPLEPTSVSGVIKADSTSSSEEINE